MAPFDSLVKPTDPFSEKQASANVTKYLVTFAEACSPDSVVPEAATTVLCTHDVGRHRRPKHVE